MTSEQGAKVLYLGSATGRATIELRVNADGTNEAFLVPTAAPPVATGVSVTEKNGKFFVQCRIRNKALAFKPEEIVRQKVVNWLIDDLGYSDAQIGVEVGVVMGGSVHDKPADIVVYSDTSKQHAWIIVETKKPNRKDGIDQLKSYMNPTGSTFGYWTNGADERYLLRTGANDFSRPIWRLPRKGETLDDIDEPLTRDKLVPVKDLYGVFKEIEQTILAHQTVDTFDEIFKVVFAKLYDERVNLHKATAPAQFYLGLTADPATAAAKVRNLFDKAKAKWRDVYDPAHKIELNDQNIVACVKALQPYHLMRSGDVLGLAFELLVNQEMKGEMGQFFTPRQVVAMMVKMMNPSMTELVCDPACGSGGFLIYAMRSIFELINQRWDDADDRAEQRKDYAQEKLIGIDNDPRLVKVAKAYMIMENDGRGGLHGVDALDYQAWDKTLRERVCGRSLKAADLSDTSLVQNRKPTDGVSIVLTNPPFAGGIKVSTTLRQYSIAMNAKGKQEKSVERAILFVERCIDILKPGGRMAIVLPQGLFNNITDQYVRELIDKRARVLAIVGLHPFTFKPFTLAKTSVLFLQKWQEESDAAENLDYPIFTAISSRPGKTKLGDPQYQADGRTLDCDMDEIADAFLAWARKQGLEFAK